MKFTVLGADGFIGRALVNHLETAGHEVAAITRTTKPTENSGLDHVIYAIGLTGDFRSKPFETVNAHVTSLAYWLQHFSYDSFLYLSSTRVFGSKSTTHPVNEETPLTLLPNADTLYDLSKLMGEALCLAQTQAKVRVARLSNVYAPGLSPHNFLGSVLQSLQKGGEVVIREAPESSKDYVALSDVVALLEKIAIAGEQRLYHVARGTSLSHAALAAKLQKIGHGSVSFLANAPQRTFPVIDIARVQKEFGFAPRSLLDDLAQLLQIETTL